MKRATFPSISYDKKRANLRALTRFDLRSLGVSYFRFIGT